MRMRSRDERGSVLPAFLTLTVVTIVMGVFFFQTGRATDLGAEAQTGSDAAALAAADDIRSQILEWIYSGEWYHSPFVVDQSRAFAAATQYAQTNDVAIMGRPSVETVGYLTYQVGLAASTERTLSPAGFVSEDPDTDERPTFQLGNNERGRQDATARVGPGADSFLTGGFWRTGQGLGFGPSSGGGAATATRGGCPIPDAELEALADTVGVTAEFAEQSALGRYNDCDGAYGRVAVSPLTEPMKVALLKVEKAIAPQPLNFNSAYRSPTAQAIVCANTTNTCAAPGTSMHQSGLAVDVSNYATVASAVNADPSIGLCQPLPVDDAVHFSHSTGRECGGATGSAGVGAFLPYGGFESLSAQAGITVRLVE